jgi:hypothetical protein
MKWTTLSYGYQASYRPSAERVSPPSGGLSSVKIIAIVKPRS